MELLQRSNTADLTPNTMARYYMNLQQQKSLNPNIFKQTITELKEEEEEPLQKQSTLEFDLLDQKPQSPKTP